MNYDLHGLCSMAYGDFGRKIYRKVLEPIPNRDFPQILQEPHGLLFGVVTFSPKQATWTVAAVGPCMNEAKGYVLLVNQQ